MRALIFLGFGSETSICVPTDLNVTPELAHVFFFLNVTGNKWVQICKLLKTLGLGLKYTI